MRIAFVNATSELGGADVALLRLAEGLIGRGHEVTAYLPREGPLCDAMRQAGVCLQFVSMPLLSGRAPLMRRALSVAALLPSAVTLARAIAIERPDVVHVNSMLAAAGGLAGRLAGRPVVWHVREIQAHAPVAAAALATLADLVSSITLANSRATARFKQRSSAMGREAELFHDPLPPSLTGDSLDEVAAWSRRLESAYHPLVGACCRLHPGKGLSTLIEAAALLRKRRPDVGFAVAYAPIPGCEPYRELLLQRIGDLGLADRFQLLEGGVGIAGFYRQLNVLCVPTEAWLSEGFGLAAAEALSVGLPVVASRTGGIVELLDDPLLGTLVEPGNATALAAAIEQWLAEDHPELAGRRRESVSRRFGMASALDRLEAIYERVVSARR